MAELTYTVTLPNAKGSGFIGYLSYYGYRFENGVAHGVRQGMALDEFKDWGAIIECENPPKESTPLTEAEVEKVAKQVANAHRRARSPQPE